MKKLQFIALVTLMLMVGTVYTLFAQAPEGINYQAEARDSRGNLLVNKTLTVKTTVLLGTPGSRVWEMDYSVTTDMYGMFTLTIGELGTGTLIDGDFSEINWGSGTYFLNVKIYYKSNWINTGTTQLLSVPYALFAKSAGSAGTETDPVFKASPSFGILSTDITKWNSAYGWGDHNGLYRPLSYVPAWSEITSNPFSFSSVQNNQLLKFNSTSGKWENWTPNYIAGYTETDPVFGAWNKSTGISVNSSQVIDFQSSVTNNAAVVANTAKVTNATHTGDVTGSGGLTIANKVTMTAAIPVSVTGNPTVIATSPVSISIAAATTGSSGSMSASDKTKLDAISGTNTGDETASTIQSKLGITTLSGSNTGDQNLASVLTKGNSASNKTISDLSDPVNPQDAATKAYVDALVSRLSKAGAIVADNDGHIYSTVRIGSQVWMGENLKTTKYNDGSAIPLVTENSTWLSLTTDAYCWYDNNQTANGNTYGALYNWHAVHTGKLCPVGWHVPSYSEFNALRTFLGGEVAGGKMKTTGTIEENTGLWKDPNTGATNESGFSALPGGGRYFNSLLNEYGFFDKDRSGYWWSSTDSYDIADKDAIGLFLKSDSGDLYHDDYFPKDYGFSIRCVRD